MVAANPSRTAHAAQIAEAADEMAEKLEQMSAVEIAAGGTNAAIAQGKTAERLAYTAAAARYGELVRAYVDTYGWEGLHQ